MTTRTAPATDYSFLRPIERPARTRRPRSPRPRPYPSSRRFLSSAITYVVWWDTPDGVVVKVGRAWALARLAELRHSGARFLMQAELTDGSWEYEALATLRSWFPKAFGSAAEAEHILRWGRGWTECFHIPGGVDDLDLVTGLCIQAFARGNDPHHELIPHTDPAPRRVADEVDVDPAPREEMGSAGGDGRDAGGRGRSCGSGGADVRAGSERPGAPHPEPEYRWVGGGTKRGRRKTRACASASGRARASERGRVGKLACKPAIWNRTPPPRRSAATEGPAHRLPRSPGWDHGSGVRALRHRCGVPQDLARPGTLRRAAGHVRERGAAVGSRHPVLIQSTTARSPR